MKVPTPMTNDFFQQSREQSIVKSTIVSKYFWAWAKVIIGSQKRHGHGDKIAYIDLFAGPGRYSDGTKSTPLMILEQAVADEEMRKRLVTIFNDADIDNSRALEEAIRNVPGIEELKYQPTVQNNSVGEDIVKIFESMRIIPTLFFVDPWGYKGLSLRLVNSVLKDWGCDCIFFFNYNRINMGLNNADVAEHMIALFGEERKAQLNRRLRDLDPMNRELTIVEELAQSLKDMGGKFVLPFCFRNEAGTRTSHHLIFVSKHFKGYEIMKEIMAKESSSHDQGVPSFQYSQATETYPLLFELSRPLDDLQELLIQEFAGRTLRMVDIYEEHNENTPYIKKNYKSALVALEQQGRIEANPPAIAADGEKARRKGTFGDEVLVTFPREY